MLFSFYFIKNKYILDLGLLTKEKYKLNIYIHSIHINMTSYTHTSYTTLVMRKKIPHYYKSKPYNSQGSEYLIMKSITKKAQILPFRRKTFQKKDLDSSPYKINK